MAEGCLLGISGQLGDFCQRERGFQQEGAEQDAAEPRNIARTSNENHFSVQFSLLSSW